MNEEITTAGADFETGKEKHRFNLKIFSIFKKSLNKNKKLL